MNPRKSDAQRSRRRWQSLFGSRSSKNEGVATSTLSVNAPRSTDVDPVVSKSDSVALLAELAGATPPDPVRS
jgi:hypothetical protein